ACETIAFHDRRIVVAEQRPVCRHRADQALRSSFLQGSIEGQHLAQDRRIDGVADRDQQRSVPRRRYLPHGSTLLTAANQRTTAPRNSGRASAAAAATREWSGP